MAQRVCACAFFNALRSALGRLLLVPASRSCIVRSAPWCQRLAALSRSVRRFVCLWDAVTLRLTGARAYLQRVDMNTFIKLFADFYAKNYAGRNMPMAPHLHLSKDLELDDLAMAEFPGFLADAMRVRTVGAASTVRVFCVHASLTTRCVGVSSDAMFQSVNTVAELFEKLVLQVPGFKAFVGGDPSDMDEGDDEVDDVGAAAAEPVVDEAEARALAKLVRDSDGGVAHILTAAAQIDAGEFAGEDLLEEVRLCANERVATSFC